MADLIQSPMLRQTYAGIDNPIFVDDILAANQAILSMAAALTGLESTDFAIISGFDYDGSTNYTAGVIWLYGQFYFCPTGCTTGQFLLGAVSPQLSEGFDDGNGRNIYSSNIAAAVNSGGPGFSPVFSGTMDSYRAGSKRLMLAVNALQITAAALGSAAFLNVGQNPGTVAAGDDPRMPYTGVQLDARYAQRINVIEKGTATPYTPSGPNDPLNKGYADATYLPVLASGRTVVGDIPSGGIAVTLSFGKTLPSTSYTIILMAVSLGTPFNDATTHTPAMIDSSKSQISVQIRIQEGVGVTQNLAYDWVIIPH